MDAYTNFAISAVATAPSPATSGTSLVVTAGHGSRFPAVSFNATVWPTGTLPDPSNAEIVRVTARSTDTLTITRAQESTTARSIIVGDLIAATITKKLLDGLRTTPLLTKLKRAADQSIPNSAWTTVSWDTNVQDDVSAYSAGSPTIVTVPSGYTKVKVTVNTAWENNPTGVRYERLTKNGSADANTLRVQTAPAALNEGNKNWVTTWLTVAASDTLALMVFQSSGAARNLSGTGFPQPTEIEFEWQP